MDMTTVLQKSASVVTRQIGGETVLVPIRKSVGDLDSIYTLNETATLVWSLVDGRRTVADLRDAVVAQFQVEPDVAGTDVETLLEQLASIDAVVRVASGE